MPLHAELLVKVATDPEAQQSSVSLLRKQARLPQDRVADYRRDLVHRLVFQMINDRFDELSRKPDAQFLGAGADESRLSPTVGTFSMSAAVENGKLPAGLSTLEIESNRIKEFGFGAAELERARKWMLASYERAYTERDKSESGSYAQEYVNHFLEGRTEPRDRLRVPARQGFDPVNHRRGGRRCGPPALLGREPGDPGGFAAEGRRAGGDRRAAA